MNRDVFYIIVNEAGASVYSASDLAREEFPNLQVEERVPFLLEDVCKILAELDENQLGLDNTNMMYLKETE